MSGNQRTPSRELLGRGWQFPVAPDPVAGNLRLVSGPEKVRQSILIILQTEPGERVMRPDFGCGLRRFLMSPNSPAIRALIARDVEFALAAFEPRIRTTAVTVDPGEDPSLVLIQVAYVHRTDGRADNLVYPFYLE
jgi:phage baseplate assembly protein W